MGHARARMRPIACTRISGFATTMRVGVAATTSSSSPGFRPSALTDFCGSRTPKLLPHLETAMVFHDILVHEDIAVCTGHGPTAGRYKSTKLS